MLFPDYKNRQLRLGLPQTVQNIVTYANSKIPVVVVKVAELLLVTKTSTVYASQPTKNNIAMLKFIGRHVKVLKTYVSSVSFSILNIAIRISGAKMYIGSGKRLFSKLLSDDSLL